MTFTLLADRHRFGGAHLRRPSRAAFTMVEVMISLGLLALIAGSVSWALSQMNFSAASSRVYTCAEIIAQNESDAFLSAAPYNPQLNQVPTALAIVTNSSVPIVTPTNADGSITIASAVGT